MSIYTRGETWWIQFTAPNGERVQRSAKTRCKKEAQELHDTLKAEAWRVKNLGDKPRHTWQESVIRWITEGEGRKGLETDKVHLRWLNQHLGNRYLDEITKTTLDRIKEAKKETGVSNTTVNRVMAIIRAILNRAKDEWEWLDSVPTVRMLPEPTCRIRWLTPQEAHRLLQELPPHLEAMARFALATGLREANVTGLKWSQVDIERQTAWILPDQAKAKKAISVFLNSDALAVLAHQTGNHPERVFTYKGEPVRKAGGKAWRKALERAGIDDFHWHDLRHTWASWHVMKGTPLNALKELGGWADYDTVLKYAHLSSDHLKSHVENSKIAKPVTNLLQHKKKA